MASNGVAESGAVTVYRRSDANRWEVEAFVKAPKTGRRDNFGWALALNSSGTTLAVGAPFEDSSRTGTFAPNDASYQAALDSNDASGSGAVTVYRRSDADAWGIEAFVKAPIEGRNDNFSHALALSDDGATLAAGSPAEDSASDGVFAPPTTGYQAALESGSASGSGAVTVYRRSGSAWSVEAFVKAPVAGRNDQFGTALALSEDGATLAAGAPLEDGGALSRPVGGGSADTGNAVKDAGAVYLY